MKNKNKNNQRDRTVKRVVKRYIGDIILIYRLFETKEEETYIYSLEIVKVSLGGTSIEKKYFYDISRSRKEGEQVFNTFSRALVPPCTASEILGDILGAFIPE